MNLISALRMSVLSLIACAIPGAVSAQDEQASTAAPAFTAAQLEQMVAPIALYPDSLVTQILMAATYPLEIVEAARWSELFPSSCQWPGSASTSAASPMTCPPGTATAPASPSTATPTW